MDDKNLNDMLLARDVPPMRSNLCERILQASLSCPATKEVAWFHDWIDDALEAFMLPRPVMSLAMAVIFGVVMGMSIEFTTLLVAGEADPSGYLQAEGYWAEEFEVSALQMGDMR